MGGIIAMFLLVSIIFAVKLGAEGRLSFLGKSAKAETVAPPVAPKPPASSTPSVSPPVTASLPPPAGQPVSPNLIRADANATFVPGTENLLPPEVAHLSKDTAPGAAERPPAPPTASANAAPAPAPTAIEDIRQTVNHWASAWQGKDVDAYLKHYTDDFVPANGLTHSAWLQQRRERLGRPGDINVQLSNLDIKADGSSATARFTQSYSAQGKTLKETKTLALALHDGHWLIRQERIGQ